MRKSFQPPFNTLLVRVIYTCIGLIVLYALNCSCSVVKGSEKPQSESTSLVVSSLSGDELDKLEYQLRNARRETSPNYSDVPMLLIKSDWPYQWKGFGNPFQLRPYEEKVFPEVPHQEPPSMTKEELMLAFGWVHKNAEKYYQQPIEERTEFEKEHPQTSERGFLSYKVHPVLDIAKNWLGYYLASGRKADRLVEVAHWKGCDKLILEGSSVERSDTLDRITSPVTGDLMKINCRSFSKGNMYIDAFPLRDLRDKFGIDTSKFEEIQVHLGLTEDDTVIAFFRAYGTTGTVKSGWVLRSKANPKVGAESF